MVISFLPASNLFIRVGFVVAERILYIPRWESFSCYSFWVIKQKEKQQLRASIYFNLIELIFEIAFSPLQGFHTAEQRH